MGEREIAGDLVKKTPVNRRYRNQKRLYRPFKARICRKYAILRLKRMQLVFFVLRECVDTVLSMHDGDLKSRYFN